MLVRELINKIGFRVNESEWNSAEGKVKALMNKTKQIGRKMTFAFTLPFLAASGAALKFASDNIETQNMFNQVFKGMEDTANQWAESYADSLNRADRSTKESLATFQSFLIGMGASKDQAFEMSKELVQLSDDMSSFKNLKPEDVMRRYLAAMSGSTEATDMLGINLKAAAIEQKALQMGVFKSVQEMTELEKSIIRLAIIRETMTKQGALGDAARTMHEFANVLRSVRGLVIKLAASFGKLLIPIANKFLKVGIKIVKFISDDLSPTMKGIILVIGAMLAIIGPLLLAFTAIVTFGKAVAGAFLFIKAAAVKANISLGFMLLKFIAIAAIVIIIVALIAILIEDFIVWIKGGDSLMGKFLPKWEDLKEKIGGVYTALYELGRKSGPILRKMTSEWNNFFETIGAKLSQFTRAMNSLFENIGARFSQLVRKWVEIFEKLGGAISKIVRTIESIVGTKNVSISAPSSEDIMGTLFGQEALASLGAMAGYSRNVNVKSNITTYIPQGTPQEQQESLRKQAETGVSNIFARHISDMMLAFQEVEA